MFCLFSDVVLVLAFVILFLDIGVGWGVGTGGVDTAHGNQEEDRVRGFLLSLSTICKTHPFLGLRLLLPIGFLYSISALLDIDASFFLFLPFASYDACSTTKADFFFFFFLPLVAKEKDVEYERKKDRKKETEREIHVFSLSHAYWVSSEVRKVHPLEMHIVDILDHLI